VIRVTALGFVLLWSCTACSSAASQSNRGDPSLFDAEPDSRFSLAMRDIRFEPPTLEVGRNTLFAVELTNAGEVLHDFSIDKFDKPFAVRGSGDRDSGASRRAVHLALRPGEHGEVRLSVDEPGEYSFFCDQPGHRRGGMTGTITVR
jgi:uncharacterized cupredoxin-like copper-binding protein